MITTVNWKPLLKLRLSIIDHVGENLLKSDERETGCDSSDSLDR